MIKKSMYVLHQGDAKRDAKLLYLPFLVSPHAILCTLWNANWHDDWTLQVFA
jgi:hypothetical protein